MSVAEPYVADLDFTLHVGDVRDVLAGMPDESVHCCVTSPPYWGLRDYGTGAWEGGDPECDHLGKPFRTKSKLNENWGAGFSDVKNTEDREPMGQTCGKCGATRIDRQIGLEATPDEYVARMVEVFREVRRVLRSDGTCWLNLGDSYAGSWGAQSRGENPQLADRSVSSQQILAAPKRVNTGSWVKDDPTIKPKDLVGIPWRVAFALQADGWWLRSDIVWCLSGGARVYAKTQKGEMPMTVKDLVRLDPATVKLWNGEKWTQALGWSRSDADGTALEIELSSGERIGCTVGHQWPTQRGLIRADDLVVGDVLETTRLPEPLEPDSPRALPDKFGWLVGLYIAEGSMSGDTIQIAGHSEELEHRETALEWLTHDFGASIRSYMDGNKATICIDGPVVLAALRLYVAGRTSRDKGLKVAAWRRTDAFLRHVLNGYVSADAHYDAKNDRYRLGFTRNDRLAADLRTLCARLGLPLRLNTTTVSGFGKQWPAYKGDLRLSPTAHHNARVDGEIAAIRRSRARQFWDIGVADEPHTFALASGVMTHNSKPNPMPESVTDRPTKSHEYLFLLTKSARYFFDADAIREEHTSTRWGGPTITQPPTTKYAEATAEGFAGAAEALSRPGREWNAYPEGGRNARSVWEIATQPYSEAHFATFPQELPRRCIAAGTSERGCCPECGAPWERETTKNRTFESGSGRSGRDPVGKNGEELQGGGETRDIRRGPVVHVQTVGWKPTCDHGQPPVPCTVLDIFMGSGTTALVARKLGRKSIGIELNPEYAELCARRLGQQSLFADDLA